MAPLLLMTLSAPLLAGDPAALPALVGDGVADDTAAIQARLDTGQSCIYLPSPARCYLISRTLRLHSNQTLRLDRFTTIRLADHSDCVMLTNGDHDHGNENIEVVGGIWDMHNEGQSLAEYQRTRNWHGAYNPERYLGILMRFNRVTRLVVRELTLKDPVTFGTQFGNLEQFTICDISFDYNLKRTNMDGIHIHGNSRHGRIANLQGATNDDLVALNADDGGIFEMSRGPLEDIVVDGIHATDGYTAVRLLSAGSPIRRVRLANLFGTYRYNVVSFTNHRVHPGAASTFDDIAIDGVCCAKSGLGMKPEPNQPGRSLLSLIWIDAPAEVSGLSLSNLHRTETLWPAATIYVEPGAMVHSLQLSQTTIRNETPGPLDLLVNRGTIEQLALSQVTMQASDGPARGAVVRNGGVIGTRSVLGVVEQNLEGPAVEPPE